MPVKAGRCGGRCHGAGQMGEWMGKSGKSVYSAGRDGYANVCQETTARWLTRNPGYSSPAEQASNQPNKRTNEPRNPSGPQTKTHGTTDIDSSFHDTAPMRPNIQDTHFHSGSGIKLLLANPIYSYTRASKMKHSKNATGFLYNYSNVGIICTCAPTVPDF
jgi:hypothetical protein